MHDADVNFSLPGAIASYGLALGILQIHGKLPSSVLALITGLNAATVGIIAQAAVYLSNKAITDKFTRILVVLSAAAGLLYNALWYFPVLMAVGGVATFLWDFGLKQRILEKLAGNRDLRIADLEAQTTEISVALQKDDRGGQQQKPDQDTLGHSYTLRSGSEKRSRNSLDVQNEGEKCVAAEKMKVEIFSWKCGLIIMIAFFFTFIIIMILRAVLRNCPKSLDLLANLYLAGKHPTAAYDMRMLTICRYYHVRRRTSRHTTVGRVSITGKFKHNHT